MKKILKNEKLHLPFGMGKFQMDNYLVYFGKVKLRLKSQDAIVLPITGVSIVYDDSKAEEMGKRYAILRWMTENRQSHINTQRLVLGYLKSVMQQRLDEKYGYFETQEELDAYNKRFLAGEVPCFPWERVVEI